MAENDASSVRVYDDARQAALLFLLPGIVQGFFYYLLIENVDDPSTSPLMIAACMLCFVGPTAHFLTTTKTTRIPAGIFAACLAVLTAGLYLLSESLFGFEGKTTENVLALSVFANWLICGISVPFFRTMVERQQRFNHYPSLYEFSWSLPVIIGVSSAFTGVFWAVLALWAGLFSLIGVSLFADIFGEIWFAWPATCGAFATAIGVVREREKITLALRSILFALLRILLPVLAFATLLFAISVPVQGIDQLFDSWSATTLLILAIAGGVLLINSALGATGSPQNKVLRWSVRTQALVLPAFAAIALYAMYLRLNQYGLTLPRLVALIVVLFASGYAFSYFASVFLPAREGVIRQANIFLAAAIFAAAILVQTPVLNLWQLSASDQVARLKDGRADPAAFDYGYMQFELGGVGERALEKLKQDESLTDRDFILTQIEKVQAATSLSNYKYGADDEEMTFASLMAGGDLVLVPDTLTPETDFIEHVEQWSLWQTSCKKVGMPCYLLSVDIFTGEQPQYILFYKGFGDVLDAQLYLQNESGGWESYYLNTSIDISEESAFSAFVENLVAGNYGEGEINLKTLDVGGEQLLFMRNKNSIPDAVRLDEVQTQN